MDCLARQKRWHVDGRISQQPAGGDDTEAYADDADDAGDAGDVPVLSRVNVGLRAQIGGLMDAKRLFRPGISRVFQGPHHLSRSVKPTLNQP